MLRQRSREGVTTTSPLFESESVKTQVVKAKLSRRKRRWATIATIAIAASGIGFFEYEGSMRASATLTQAEAEAKAIGLPLHLSDLNAGVLPDADQDALAAMGFRELGLANSQDPIFDSGQNARYMTLTPTDKKALALFEGISKHRGPLMVERKLADLKTTQYSVIGSDSIRSAAYEAVTEASNRIERGDIHDGERLLRQCLAVRDRLAETSTLGSQTLAAEITVNVQAAIVQTYFEGAAKDAVLKKIITEDTFELDRSKYFASRFLRALDVAVRIKSYAALDKVYNGQWPTVSATEDQWANLNGVQKNILAAEIRAWNYFYERGDFDGYLFLRQSLRNGIIQSNKRFISEPWVMMFDDARLDFHTKRAAAKYALEILEQYQKNKDLPVESPPDHLKIPSELLMRMKYSRLSDRFDLNIPHMIGHQFISPFTLTVPVPGLKSDHSLGP